MKNISIFFLQQWQCQPLPIRLFGNICWWSCEFLNLYKELFKFPIPCSLLVSQDPYPELKIQANNAQERGNREAHCARPKSIKWQLWLPISCFPFRNTKLMTAPGKGKRAYNLATSFLWGIPDLHFLKNQRITSLKHVQNVITLRSKYFRSKSKITGLMLERNLHRVRLSYVVNLFSINKKSGIKPEFNLYKTIFSWSGTEVTLFRCIWPAKKGLAENVQLYTWKKKVK